MLWPILDRIFNLDLKYENTESAIRQRKEFLLINKLGVCDIVESAERQKVDASDLGMQNVQLRNMIGYLEAYKNLETILFMGGSSKNGPEYFFRKLMKGANLKLEVVSDNVPRIYKFNLPKTKRKITTVSLTAPSGAANRAVGSMESYKAMKDKNPNFNTLDFRVLQYQEFFDAVD